MTERQSNYPQDRLGNESRELDEVRAADGMEESGNGYTQVAGGDTGTLVEVYELPEDVRAFNLELIQAYNGSGAAGTIQIVEASKDDQGNLTEVARRSIKYNIADGSDISREYLGREFDSDVIAVDASVAVDIAIGGYADAPEEYEPNAEYTQAP